MVGGGSIGSNATVATTSTVRRPCGSGSWLLPSRGSLSDLSKGFCGLGVGRHFDSHQAANSTNSHCTTRTGAFPQWLKTVLFHHVSAIHTAVNLPRQVIWGRIPPSANHSSRSVGGGGSSSSESDSGLFSLPLPSCPCPFALRGALGLAAFLGALVLLGLLGLLARALLGGLFFFLGGMVHARSMPLCAVRGWGCPTAGSRCCFAGQRSSPAVVGRRLVAPRPRAHGVARRAWPLRSMALQGTLPYI